MRSVRFTKREADYVVSVLENSPDFPEPLVRGVVDKLRAAMEPVPDESKGTYMRPIEDALVTGSAGRVVPIQAPGYLWSRMSREAANLGVTAEKAAVLAGWLGRQGWMTSTLTIRDVLRKWPDWYSKANAEATSRANRRPGGLDSTTNVGPGSAGQRPAPSPGRRPPGLG